MGPYQYKTRAARLRQQGVQVHEFGERVLQQGCYGEDVMALQVWEQGNEQGGGACCAGKVATGCRAAAWPSHAMVVATAMP